MDKEIIISIDTMIYTLENSLKYIKHKKQEIIETNDIAICPEIFMEIQNCFMNLNSSHLVMKIIRVLKGDRK